MNQQHKKKLNAFSARRSRARKIFQAAVNEGSKTKQNNALKIIHSINKDEDAYRNEHGLHSSQREHVADEAIRENSISIDYLYYEGPALTDFVLTHKIAYYVKNKRDGYNKAIPYTKGAIKKFREPKIKIANFLGMSVKKDADLILSWISKIFTGSKQNSTKVVRIYIEGDSVVDYEILNDGDV